jgi:hypothetical protein
VFVWDHSKGLAAVYAVEKREISLVSFLQKTQMSEANVKVAWVEIYGFIA